MPGEAAVCLLWEVVSVILTPITWLVEIILAIPIIGRLISEILNIVTMIVWRVVGLLDAVLTVIGIRPLKKLRLCIVILRDEKGNSLTTQAALQPAIDAARQIYRDAARS